MDFDDYLRDKATVFRMQADETEDQDEREELRELATVCEEIANDIDDHHTAG
jgi:hypothetical protein